jgi:hypothetical protein
VPDGVCSIPAGRAVAAHPSAHSSVWAGRSV